MILNDLFIRYQYYAQAGTMLIWIRSTDNVSVLGYRVLLQWTVQIGSLLTIMCCLDLIQIMNYSLSIMHLDAAGNISNSSNPYYCNYIGGAPRSCRAVVFKE
jgi:hypothetical protein